jgi:hypothetical protein
VASHQLHVALDLRAHLPECSFDTGLPSGGEWKKIVAPHADRFGPKRKRLQHMCSPLDSAVHNHINTISHSIDDLRQLIKCGA